MIANKHAKVDCPKNTPVPRAHTLHSQTPWLMPLLWQPISSQIFHSHRSWLTRCKFHVHSELTTVWNTNFLRWNCPISLLHRLGLCLEGGRIARNKSRKVHRHKSMSTRVLQNIISVKNTEWWLSLFSWHQEYMGWYTGGRYTTFAPSELLVCWCTTCQVVEVANSRQNIQIFHWNHLMGAQQLEHMQLQKCASWW